MALLMTALTLACTVCNSGGGKEVRAGILDDHLTVSLLATLLPFAVVALVTACIHFAPPRRSRHDRTR